jgi:hypothetical protein
VKSTTLFSSVLGILLAGAAALGSAGCTTDAFCFDNCTGATGSGSSSASGAGGAGGGILTGSGGSGGESCFPNCTATTGTGCAPTNGGVEICDSLDNDCNGKVDDADFTSGRSCGNCATNCYATLLNCEVTAIGCTPPPQNLGTDPGTCVCGKCTPDYYDLDKNGTCEYYCVQIAPDDTTCDNIDDDCDGVKDEDVDLCTSTTNCGQCGSKCFAGHSTSICVHTGAGACDTSNTQCEIKPGGCDCNGPGDCWWDLDNSYATGCEYKCDLTSGGVEICDGLDNDCDGKIDNADDLSGDTSLNQVCHGGVNGECATAAHAGITACVGAQVVCTGASVLVPNQQLEKCDGKDDDCDGAVDDSPTDTGGACGSNNVFPCSLGTFQCQGGALVCVGAINPGVETCNGQDDNCDGTIDKTGNMAPADSVGACNVPKAPPPGATSPCVAGAKACVGGTIQCVGGAGPIAAQDSCKVDANCDGVLTNQPDLMTDVHNCGACGNDCLAGAVHASWSCVAGACAFQGCQTGFHDLSVPADKKCEYACTYVSAQEACNGTDDNCNGQVDESVTAPTPSQICGVSPSATAAECTGASAGGMIGVACVGGAWKCTFPAGVCSPTCAGATEVCDALDNNCNGVVNENTPNYQKPCASDDGLPAPGDGACRTTGTYACTGANSVACSAVKDTTKAGAELCDGLDNDCDGVVDETFNAKGSNATYFVKPAVTKIAASTWIYSYEASRPSAGTITPGTGNGYRCKAFNAADPSCNDATIPSAPASATIDKTPACSVQGKIPWYNVTPPEAEQTCKSMGGRLCTTPEWQTACTTNPPSGTTCTWGYNTRGVECTSGFTAGTKLCNLGASFDFDGATPGVQSGLLVTGSSAVKNCWADWSGLLGNSVTTNKIADITGNLREITKSAASTYPLMGGAFNTQSEAGAACSFSFYTVDPSFQLFDLGYRCCFSADPTL